MAEKVTSEKPAEPVKVPTPQEIDVVLLAAQSAPLQNLQHARELEKSLMTLTLYLRHVLGAPVPAGTTEKIGG